MILNLLPIFLLVFWLYYGFTNDLDEILLYPPIFLLIPYFFLVTKIRSIRVMKKFSPFDTPITNGHIERGLNPTFAIIAERDKGAYKLIFQWKQKKPEHRFSTKFFIRKYQTSQRQGLLYIQFQLEKELISYAPHKGATIVGTGRICSEYLR